MDPLLLQFDAAVDPPSEHRKDSWEEVELVTPGVQAKQRLSAGDVENVLDRPGPICFMLRFVWLCSAALSTSPGFPCE